MSKSEVSAAKHPDVFDADAVRASFEDAFLNYFGRGPSEDAVFDRLSESWLKRSPDGRYEVTRVDDAWTGWLAAARRYAHIEALLSKHLKYSYEVLRAEGYDVTDIRAALEQVASRTDAASDAQSLQWAKAPFKTEWGEGMMVSDVALSKDAIAIIYCHKADIHLVAAAIAKATGGLK